MFAIGWLIIMAVLIIIELATLGLTTIWFAAGAFAAFIAAALDLALWIQIGAVYHRVACFAVLYKTIGCKVPECQDKQDESGQSHRKKRQGDKDH